MHTEYDCRAHWRWYSWLYDYPGWHRTLSGRQSRPAGVAGGGGNGLNGGGGRPRRTVSRSPREPRLAAFFKLQLPRQSAGGADQIPKPVK
jgi:hypothetical protein